MSHLKASSLVGLLVYAMSSGAIAQTAPPFLPDIPGEWTQFTPGPIEVDGSVLTPTCSGYPGTDPTFHFWAKRGTSNNLVVFFEGGGACWDSLSCTFPILDGLPPQVPQFYKPMIPPGDDPRVLSGIFDLSNPRNPVADWSFVYVPYCTGDIHLGSSDQVYENVGMPGLPATFAIRHRGSDNFKVVLEWMTESFRGPHHLLVTGSSAGAYGAIGNFGWIREAFPSSHAAVLADAGQGITTAAWEPLRGTRWNMQLPEWIFGPSPTTASTADFQWMVAAAYPDDKFSQYTTAWDAVQILFYSVMRQFYGPGGEGSTCEDWNEQMLEGLAVNQQEDNFRSYLAAGTGHVLMANPLFYAEGSAGIGFAEWLDGMLKSEGGANGYGGLPWANVACTDCQAPAVCPF